MFGAQIRQQLVPIMFEHQSRGLAIGAKLGVDVHAPLSVWDTSLMFLLKFFWDPSQHFLDLVTFDFDFYSRTISNSVWPQQTVHEAQRVLGEAHRHAHSNRMGID